MVRTKRNRREPGDVDVVLGVDPGVSGAVAVLTKWGDLREIIRLDATLADIADAIFNVAIGCTIKFCLLERVASMPKQGVSSTFKFGRSYGQIEAMIAYEQIRYELMTPSEWQGKMRCSTSVKTKEKGKPKKDKNITKAAAQKLFPDFKVTHRNSEALLIAELARRMALERGWIKT